jgi:hypothetical protein
VRTASAPLVERCVTFSWNVRITLDARAVSCELDEISVFTRLSYHNL